MNRALIIVCLILWGPLYRALIDKLWMYNANLVAVGQWAQLQTISDFVATPAFVGVGVGLTVLVAQIDESEYPQIFLSAYFLGLATTLPTMILISIFSSTIEQYLQLGAHLRPQLQLASLIGWLGVAGGLLGSYWLGKSQQNKLFLFSVLTSIPILSILASSYWKGFEATSKSLMYALLIISTGVNLYIGIYFYRWKNKTKNYFLKLKNSMSLLVKYLPAGFSIGLLTPLSMLISRSLIANNLDWESAGATVALLRASDWILNIAQSTLYFHFLPKISKEINQTNPIRSLFRISIYILAPSLMALILLYIMREPILHLLYDSRLNIDSSISLIFWSGDFLRIVSAIFLMGLYSLHCSKTIAWGEFLSQPLYALLLFLGAASSLISVGLAHLGTYFIYALFCFTCFIFFARERR